MTPTERAYVGGIIDGEGCIEFKWADRIRKNRKGTPTYHTLIVRMEVPQVDKRLIDYLMEITKEGTRDIKHYPKNPTYRTLICRLEVPQVDKRLIDWLMEITQEGTRDIKRYPNHPNWHDQHRWRVGYHGVYRVLKQVHPYLIIKKQKAKLVIDHYDKQFFKKTFGKGGFGVK